MRAGTDVILGVTASIAIYKACDLVRRLQDAGFGVDVVMTEEATQLVRPVVFQSLSGRKVHHEMFAEASSWEVEHIALAQRAKAVVIAPATAHVIAKIAHGLCDDLLTCVVAATKAPVVIAPAMNENMFLNRITQRNIKTLQDAGYRFVMPRTGKLACGSTGVGCLADVDTIVKEVRALK